MPSHSVRAYVCVHNIRVLLQVFFLFLLLLLLLLLLILLLLLFLLLPLGA
jgi:hypothetical protein